MIEYRIINCYAFFILNGGRKGMKKILFYSLIITLSAFMPIYADDSYTVPSKIVLSGTLETKNSLQGKFLKMVYTEAFKRLGIEFEYKGFPAKRSSFMSDTGKTDGEISRVYEYLDTHPNMVRVKEYVIICLFNAYAFKPGIKLDGWESLKGTDYNVEYRRGVKKCEAKLPEVVSKEKLSAITSIKSGAKKLINRRTDILITLDYIMNELLLLDEFKNSGIYIAGIMDSSTTAHAFLHKKHKLLVPKLSSVLKQMKTEGLLEKYNAAAFNTK
jgi:hypothetical protein